MVKFLFIYSFILIFSISFLLSQDNNLTTESLNQNHVIKIPTKPNKTIDIYPTFELQPIQNTKIELPQTQNTQNTNTNIQSITILKGANNLTDSEKAEKQILTIGNMQIFIATTLIKDYQQNSNNIIINLTNGQSFTVYENVVEMPNNVKITLEDNQSFNLEQSQNNNTISISPTSENQTTLHIQDTDSSGNTRTYSLYQGDKIGLNTDATILAITGDITIESQGQSIQLKEGTAITTDNTIPTAIAPTTITPTTEIKDTKNTPTTTPTTTTTETTEKNTKQDDQQAETKKEPETTNTNYVDNTDTESTSLTNEPDITNEPTDFGNDLTNFSPTQLR